MTTHNSVIANFKKKYKKALVTGGAGFIGSHVCEELVKNGITTISLDNYIAGKRNNIDHLNRYKNFSEVICDIRDKEELMKHLRGVDVIFHQAASKKTVCLVNPQKDLEINAKGTLNLLQLANQLHVKKFVHASTGSVYGEAIVTPQDENHPLNPVSFYGVSKLAGEKYVSFFNKVHGLDTTILRYFHVYGPRQEFNDFGGVVAIFVRNLLQGERPTIFGSGAQERSFTYVKDVAWANILSAVTSKARGETYNCASGIKVTIQELCDLVIEAFGKKGKIKPIYKDWVYGDIKKFDINNQKIRDIGASFTTNFERQLLTTIKQMVSYINNESRHK